VLLGYNYNDYLLLTIWFFIKPTVFLINLQLLDWSFVVYKKLKIIGILVFDFNMIIEIYALEREIQDLLKKNIKYSVE